MKRIIQTAIFWFVLTSAFYTFRYQFAAPFQNTAIGYWQLEAFIPVFFLSPLATLLAIRFYRWRQHAYEKYLERYLRLHPLPKVEGGEQS